MNSTTVIRALVLKEFRQLRRSKRALVTAVLMPAFFLLYFPLLQGGLMVPKAGPSSPVDIDISPIEAGGQPGGPPVTFCALVTVVGSNDPVPGVTVRFSPDANFTPTSDRAGKACAAIPVPGQFGSFPVTALPINRQLHLLASTGHLTVGRSFAVFPPRAPAPSGFAAILASPRRLFVDFLFPFFLVMAAALAPMSFAIQTVSAERDRGTVPLLTALPVRVTQILAAKVFTTVAVASAVLFPLFAIDAIVLGVDGLGGAIQAGLDLLLLLSGIVASGGLTLLVTLLVKDIRTSGQLMGFMTLPGVLVLGGVLFAVPAPWSLLAAAGLLLVTGAVSVFAAQRWITFERYLD